MGDPDKGVDCNFLTGWLLFVDAFNDVPVFVVKIVAKRVQPPPHTI
jgi:hypothetical protein